MDPPFSTPPPADVPLSTIPQRRARTTDTQLQILQAFFDEQTAYPDKEQKEQLARRVGFTAGSVHFWFQNHRQTMRYVRERRQHRGSAPPTATTAPEQQQQQQQQAASSNSGNAHQRRPIRDPSTQQASAVPTRAHEEQSPTPLTARLPPFSSFVQEQAAPLPSPQSGTTPRQANYSAFTPTTTMAPQSSSAADSGPLILRAPGSARLPPVHFYFHHPEYGMEASMLQLLAFNHHHHHHQRG